VSAVARVDGVVRNMGAGAPSTRPPWLDCQASTLLLAWAGDRNVMTALWVPPAREL
jgi:hypothetical protein